MKFKTFYNWHLATECGLLALHHPKLKFSRHENISSISEFLSSNRERFFPIIVRKMEALVVVFSLFTIIIKIPVKLSERDFGSCCASNVIRCLLPI